MVKGNPHKVIKTALVGGRTVSILQDRSTKEYLIMDELKEYGKALNIEDALEKFSKLKPENIFDGDENEA